VRVALTVVRERLGAERVQLFGDRLHVRADDPDDGPMVVDLLGSKGIEVTSVRPITPTLEDVFIERLLAATAGARHEGHEVGGP
jgi:hypothetical protein